MLLQRHGPYRIAHIALYTDDNLARSPAIATAVRRSQRGSYLDSSAYIHALFLRYVVLSISNHNYQDSDRKRRSVVKIPASTPRAAEPTLLRISDVAAKRSAGHFIIALPFEVLEFFFSIFSPVSLLFAAQIKSCCIKCECIG